MSIKGGTPGNVNGQDYTFSASFGPTLTSRVYSTNVLRKNPGVSGMTVTSSGSPKPGLQVQLRNATGSLVATTTTDQDGFYQIPYKHTGKAATFTVALPAYNRQESINLKANGSALALFDEVADLGGRSIATDPLRRTPVTTSP